MSISKKSKVVAIGETSTELLACVTGGNTTVTSLIIGNVDGSNDATFDLSINKNGGGDTTVMSSITVAAGKAVIVFSESNGKLYMTAPTTPDTLDATASAADDLVAIISYIEET